MPFTESEITTALNNLESAKKNTEDNFHLFKHQPDLSWFINQGTKSELTKDKK